MYQAKLQQHGKSSLPPSKLFKKQKNNIEPTPYQVNALSVINTTVSQADRQAYSV